MNKLSATLSLLTLCAAATPAACLRAQEAADTATVATTHADTLRSAAIAPDNYADSVYQAARAADTVQDTIVAPWDNPMPDEDVNYVNDSTPRIVAEYDSLAMEVEWSNDKTFNPVPAKAVWYAALFPGGGQIYNRKYWKLPIIYGGLLGLIYGYQWNNRYYKTYSNAYRDLVLGSPNASYMDFLPPNYDVRGRYNYLERVFKRKKNSYRNYRDYCVVGMIAVYLVGMVDAYVDAALYHFDVSPNLDANNEPMLMLGYTYTF